jgi:hypothetical protein
VYYSQFNESYFSSIEDELQRSLLMYDQIVKTTAQFDDKDYTLQLREEYVNYLKMFQYLLE